MPYRSYRHRPMSMLPRKKPRYVWIHDTFNNVSPAASNTDDLLGNFKAQWAISANFPEITIWRFHIKISARITLTAAAAANTGILFSAFVDSAKQLTGGGIVSQATNPNDEHYLLYEQFYVLDTQVQNNTSVANAAVIPFYKNFDVRSHRKLVNINDTLMIQGVITGSATFTDYSYSVGILLRLP